MLSSAWFVIHLYCGYLKARTITISCRNLHPMLKPLAVTSDPAMNLYLVGVPGRVGGASTKLAHLIRLLHRHFEITLLCPNIGVSKDAGVREILKPFGIRCCLLKDLPAKVDGVALAICNRDFFSSTRARDIKQRGIRVIWSNEMMWPFEGEATAVKEGLVDRVLFVSEFQAKVFSDMYRGVDSRITGNYVDPDDYCWRPRMNPVFTLGRLSRPDPTKYPLDFPVFYEEMGLSEVRYRVMAWSHELQRQYKWHHFGSEWELLPANKQSALNFLYSLDVFLYPLGHRVKESWGRAVVEAMLSGAVPVVPAGHQFHNLIVSGETGYICSNFREFQAVVRELYENYPWRTKLSRQAADYARERLCNPDDHQRTWIEALTF